MLRKILCILAVLAMCTMVSAFAEEAPQPVTAEELAVLLETVRTEALAAVPLNDPAAEDAQSEDGTCFQYENALIYAEGTVLSADTPVNALVFEDSEGPVFRGTGIDTRLDELLAVIPVENRELAGSREEAVLFLQETEEGGFVYGRILRDGQRVQAVEYGEVLPEGEQYRRAAVTCRMQSGLVTSLRADGLNPSGGALMDSAHAEELLAELKELSGHDEYRAVASSVNGLELTPFDENDLIFDGFSYPALQPATLPGMPEQELIDNGDGTWLMRCDAESYEAVFRCDGQGENAEILSFTLLDDMTEGPRCVRLGDLFSDDFCRFRSGENEMAEDMTELLYGTEDTDSWGYADYNPEDMTLRYVTGTAAGVRVELLLKYENNILTEIILHTV